MAGFPGVVSPSEVLVIAGPTAVGKSSLALAVAEQVGGEIASADSRQLYRGLDVGTAKPTAAEQRRVPHHLLDRLDLGQRATAGQYRTWFDEVAADVASRNRPLIVVGGSTLYVHALVEGLAELPPVPTALEADLLRVVASQSGARDLFDELAAADPKAAATLDPTKTHRLVRLVGVWRTTGRPPSELWAASQTPRVSSRLVVLDRPRETLYARIDRRVDAMVEHGLVDEAKALLDRGPAARRTLAATIGYQELLPVFDGERSLDEAIPLIKRNSRRYAKRQLTWYRRYADALWMDARTATPQNLLDAPPKTPGVR